MDKQTAARRFNLPVEQIKTYDELTPAQKEQAAHYFGEGARGYSAYLYAVKKDGNLVWNRE